MLVRDFHPDDASALAQVFHASVRIIGTKDYTQSQVSSWSPQPVEAEDFLKRVSDGRNVFVAVNDMDEPEAFIELEKNGHIDCFYCHPNVAGTDVGSALYDRLESTAKQSGIDYLFVEASEAAKRFFSRKGFVVEHRHDFERRGVAIHNYRMVKVLKS
ncbi:GNAT family N-acetyltransferase [Rhodobacteraceae bacterium R_SAG10]|nr:GNAT family N-acetyltransferase [Rhodobacteraceae bacterium R_SAG10]